MRVIVGSDGGDRKRVVCKWEFVVFILLEIGFSGYSSECA